MESSEIQELVARISTILMIGWGAYALYKIIRDFVRIGREVTNALRDGVVKVAKATDTALKTEQGMSVAKGLSGLVLGLYATKKAIKAKSPMEHDYYRELMRQGTEIMEEANNELERRRS